MEKELQEKWSRIDITTLEKTAEENQHKSRGFQKEFIEILIYLKATNRYKENKLYLKSSFWTYLDERFLLRRGTFQEMQRAFVKFPDETIKHGIGLVAKVDRRCGALEVKKVFSEIDKAQESKPIKRELLDKIIHKHRDPERDVKVEHKDWKAMYLREVEAHNRTRETLKEAEGQVCELQAQLEKLKATASIVSRMRKVMGGPEVQPAA